MALSDQIDLAEFFSVIYQNFINAEIWQFAAALPRKMAYTAMF